MFTKKAPYTSRPSTIAVLFSICLAAAHIYQCYGAEIRAFPDSEHYSNLARSHLPELLWQSRPPLSIAIFRVFLDTPAAMCLFQVVIYISAWSTLFAAVAYTVRPLLLQFAVTAALFYFALYPDFAQWSKTLLTETSSISLSVFAVATFLLWLKTNHWLYLTLLVSALAVNGQIRDSAALFGLLLGAVVGVVAFVRKNRIAAVTTVLILLANFLFSNWSAAAPGAPALNARWLFPMFNIIGRVILPNPEYTAFFAARGMPTSEAVMSMSGLWAHERDIAFYVAPELEELREWTRSHGKLTYLQFLLAHPRFVLSEPWKDKKNWLHLNNLSTRFYIPKNFTAFDSVRIGFKYVYILNVVIVIAFCLLILIRRDGDALLRLFIVASFFLIGVAMAEYAFHAGSPMEVPRHSLPTPLQAVLLLAVAAALAKPIENLNDG